METAKIQTVLDMVDRLEKMGFTEIWLGYKDWISKAGRAENGFEEWPCSVVVRPKIADTASYVHSIVHKYLGSSAGNGWQAFGKTNIPIHIRGHYDAPNIKAQILIKELEI